MIEVFEGSEQFIDGVDAALTFTHSAIVVRGAIRNARRHFSGDSEYRLLAMREGLPGLTQAESRIMEWEIDRPITFTGIYNGRERNGGIKIHYDGYAIGPFALSLGIVGVGNWRSQLMTRHSRGKGGDQFDPTQPIDEFTQEPDDIVLVPGMTHPSVHEVTAESIRLARVFAAYCAHAELEIDWPSAQ